MNNYDKKHIFDIYNNIISIIKMEIDNLNINDDHEKSNYIMNVLANLVSGILSNNNTESIETINKNFDDYIAGLNKCREHLLALKAKENNNDD